MARAKTVSKCITETAEGSHVFSITEYSQKRGMGVGKCVRSGAFSVGGHD
jgi:speckle-type POZ protein